MRSFRHTGGADGASLRRTLMGWLWFQQTFHVILESGRLCRGLWESIFSIFAFPGRWSVGGRCQRSGDLWHLQQPSWSPRLLRKIKKLHRLGTKEKTSKHWCKQSRRRAKNSLYCRSSRREEWPEQLQAKSARLAPLGTLRLGPRDGFVCADL